MNALRASLMEKLAIGGNAVDIKALGMGALLDVFVHKAKEECQVDLLTIFLHDAAKDELIARWATAFPSDFSHDAKAYVRIPQNAGLVGRSFQSGDLVDIEDAYLEPGFNKAIDHSSGYRTKSVVACPIIGDATIQDIAHTAKGEGPHRLGAFQLINRLDSDEAKVDDDDGSAEDGALESETIDVKCLDSPSGQRTIRVKAFDAIDKQKIRGLSDAVVELAKLAYGLHRPGVRTTAARNCIKSYEEDSYAVLGLHHTFLHVPKKRPGGTIVRAV